MDAHDMMTKRRSFLQLAAVAAATTAGGIGLRSLAFAVASALMGKNLAADKGMNISVYDGKGDPSTQTTQLLDVVSKQPDIILLNPVDAKLLQGGVRQANQANIPLFMLENLPPQGDWIAYNTFDDV